MFASLESGHEFLPWPSDAWVRSNMHSQKLSALSRSFVYTVLTGNHVR
jgi:hypothetical protein